MPSSNASHAPRKGSSTSSSAAHLARVRDNQRRSRARRKEYLQDLEDRFRKCQEKGVEASAEMQQAARRVLEENKRLRMALLAKGMTDEEVDRLAVDTAASSPPSMDIPESAAVSELDSMLSKSRSSPSDLESSKRSSEESVTTEASMARAQVLMPRATGDVFAPVLAAVNPLGVQDPRQQYQHRMSPVSMHGSSDRAAYGMPDASLSMESAYTASLPQESHQATNDWTLPQSQASTEITQLSQGYSSASSSQTWSAQGQFGSPQGPLAGAESGGQLHVPTLAESRPRSHSGTSQQHGLSGGEVDMSELLSPELQAQLTAALEGHTLQLSGELGAGDSRRPQWDTSTKW